VERRRLVVVRWIDDQDMTEPPDGGVRGIVADRRVDDIEDDDNQDRAWADEPA